VPGGDEPQRGGGVGTCERPDYSFNGGNMDDLTDTMEAFSPVDKADIAAGVDYLFTFIYDPHLN